MCIDKPLHDQNKTCKEIVKQRKGKSKPKIKLSPRKLKAKKQKKVKRKLKINRRKVKTVQKWKQILALEI